MHYKKEKTIFNKVMTPLVIFIVLQTIIYLSTMSVCGVFSIMRQATYDVFDQKVENKNLYLQNLMKKQWSNLSVCEEFISNSIESTLTKNNMTSQDIKTNTDLNEQIVLDVTQQLIDTMKKNQTSGIYFMLNGIGIDNDINSYAGSYIKYYDPYNSNDTPLNNDNLFLLCGLPEISTDNNIALDSNWKSTYKDNDNCNSLIYNMKNIINTSNQFSNKNSENFGRWATISNDVLHPNENLLTYSIPVILSTGEVVGVIGVDISENMLKEILDFQELNSKISGTYFLGYTKDEGKTYNRAFVNGFSYYSYIGEIDTITRSSQIYNNSYRFLQEKNNDAFLAGSIQELNLYNNNTPYENEQWVLIGFDDMNSLEKYADYSQYIIIIICIVNLGIGFFMVLIVSGIIINPIKKLISDLESSDTKKTIKLKKLNIKEIDTLSSSIEKLSNSVTESASRIYKVIRLTDFPLGVYELQRTDDKVYCSGSLFKIMGWEGSENGDDAFIPLRTFNQLLNVVYQTSYDSQNNIFEISSTQFGTKWVQIFTQIDDNEVLGIIIDCSQDVLAKKKIEFERDYDALTGILNKRAFDEKINRILNNKNIDIKQSAFLMMDLDGLKQVNDTFGHQAGDNYICALADILKQKLFINHSIIARRSGDEFYCFFYGYDDRNEIRDLVDDIWENLKQTEIDTHNAEKYKLSASGGITWCTTGFCDYELLINRCDIAMYRVKATTKNAYIEFDISMTSEE